MTGGIEERFHRALGSGVRLAVITGAVVVTLVLLHELTAPRIAQHEQRALVATLIELTNDPRIAMVDIGARLPARLRLCVAGRTHYRMVRSSTPGYSGPIEFIVALAEDDRLLGVRVLHHTETPGLGDVIEVGKSDWIRQLADHPSDFTRTPGWAVREDGGGIDAATGATITSRSLLAGVAKALAEVGPVAEVPCTPLT